MGFVHPSGPPPEEETILSPGNPRLGRQGSGTIGQPGIMRGNPLQEGRGTFLQGSLHDHRLETPFLPEALDKLQDFEEQGLKPEFVVEGLGQITPPRQLSVPGASLNNSAN
jgi:hypothetical protein